MKETACRNICFDIFKGIACIAVVFMHIEFPGITGTIVQCVTRWSVPFFFAISGYFFQTETVWECARKGKHIAKLTLYGVLFYVIVNTLHHLLLGNHQGYVLSEFTLKNLIGLVLFNQPFYVSGVLWFLFSLLYVYAAYAAMIQLRLTKFNRLFCVVLMVMHFMLGYGALMMKMGVYKALYRNWLFEGMPCFLLGKEIFRYVFDTKRRSPQGLSRLSQLLIPAGILMSLLERWILGVDFSVHIGSIVVVIGMLVFGAVSNVPTNSLTKILATIGRDYSLVVYIVHMAVYQVMLDLFRLFHASNSTLFLWTAPILTAAGSLCIAVLLDQLKTGRKKEAGV